jgi:hypothetical protein
MSERPSTREQRSSAVDFHAIQGGEAATVALEYGANRVTYECEAWPPVDSPAAPDFDVPPQEGVTKLRFSVLNDDAVSELVFWVDTDGLLVDLPYYDHVAHVERGPDGRRSGFRLRDAEVTLH